MITNEEQIKIGLSRCVAGLGYDIDGLHITFKQNKNGDRVVCFVNLVFSK